MRMICSGDIVLTIVEGFWGVNYYNEKDLNTWNLVKFGGKLHL